MINIQFDVRVQNANYPHQTLLYSWYWAFDTFEIGSQRMRLI